MTATATLGGLDVLSGRLSLPLSGISTGELDLDGAELAVGPADLMVLGDGEPSVTLAVCVSQVSIVEGRIRASIVGGRSGGLSRSSLAVDVPALHYDGDPTPASAWEVLTDIAELAGEVMDASQEDALRAFTAPSWLREAAPAHRAVARALGHWGLSARVLPSGDLWAGEETWPDALLEPPAVDPIDDGWMLYVAPNGAGLQPGEVVREKRVQRVEYLFAPDALRARLHYREGA